MKVVEIEQRTAAWRDWRMAGITASDSAAVLGRGKFKTRWQLWAEKTGLRAEDDPEGNPYVRRGQNFEHMLRETVVADRKIGLLPLCVECSENPVLRASLDAIDDRLRPWEFKIPSRGNYQLVKKDGLSSQVAQDYLPQIQHQMICTGASEGFLVFGDLDDTRQPPKFVEYVVLIVPADPVLQAQIIEECAKFHELVQTCTEPEKDPDRDVFAPLTDADAQKWTEAAGRMLPLLDRKAELKAQIDEIEKQIAEASEGVLDVLADNRIGEFAGLRAIKVTRTGPVDWTKYAQSKGDDPKDETIFKPFRKADTSHHQYRALT